MAFYVVHIWIAVLIAHGPQITSCKDILTTVKLCNNELFFEAMFFVMINFQKANTNIYTLLIILIVKSLQKELDSTNLPE